MSAARRRIAGSALALLAAANAVVVAGLWLRSGGPDDVVDSGTLLVAAGRVSGLLGAYLVLLELLLIARLPPLERLVGFDRVCGWHRRLGSACVTLLAGHAALVIAGNALADGL